MKIGPYELSSPFVLAPMAGVTDAPFRRLCRRFGAGMTTSEMTTADIRLWKTAKSRRRLDLDMDTEPVARQQARLCFGTPSWSAGSWIGSWQRWTSRSR
jgi:tRNA-dihydrouridine synthase B